MSAEKDLLDTITEELDNTHGPAIDISPEMEAAILGDDVPMAPEPVSVVKPTPVGRGVPATVKKASKPNPPKQNRALPYVKPAGSHQSPKLNQKINFMEALGKFNQKMDMFDRKIDILLEKNERLWQLFLAREGKAQPSPSTPLRYETAQCFSPSGQPMVPPGCMQSMYPSGNGLLTPMKPSLPVKFVDSSRSNPTQPSGRVWTGQHHTSVMQHNNIASMDFEKPSIRSVPPPSHVSSTMSSSFPVPICHFCSCNHSSYACDRYPDLETRVEFLIREGRCSSCMATHKGKPCEANPNVTCSFCHLKGHPKALCPKQFA